MPNSKHKGAGFSTVYSTRLVDCNEARKWLGYWMYYVLPWLLHAWCHSKTPASPTVLTLEVCGLPPVYMIMMSRDSLNSLIFTCSSAAMETSCAEEQMLKAFGVMLVLHKIDLAWFGNSLIMHFINSVLIRRAGVTWLANVKCQECARNLATWDCKQVVSWLVLPHSPGKGSGEESQDNTQQLQKRNNPH